MNTLHSILAYEKRLYFKDRKSYLKGKLCCTNDYQIWRFILLLRKAEYYENKSKIAFPFMLPYLYYRHRKNKRGAKLGFDIPEGCFAPGLRIYHVSPVIVNPAARIGKDCIIVGDVCIGNVKGQAIAPQIGEYAMFGWGSCALVDITIADHCMIGAGSVVTHSVLTNNAVLLGIPAKQRAK